EAVARRLATVVFVELEPLSGAVGALDPERLRLAGGRVLAALTRALEQHGGEVQLVPGGAVAAVGLTSGHEQDAERAIRAAVEAIDAVAAAGARLAHELAGPPRVSVGVASGEVIAASDWFVGGQVVLAARQLSGAAGPGEVVLDAATVELAPGAGEYTAD